ncbi:LCP family protein [Streptomyces nigrescens]|uniref:LCP family protein n=1 Tax=Streptomyces nigrescens TaxID=1920 RepID=A0A640TEE9_STRNI|nr:LCP family protein [Streptomyces libani]WAT96673.1 LCP family protein [Streptomyces libani subsp. libani]GFE22059.1 transcriptional regulator [Streptomyces libani subsp. libani]GGV89911.1 transcriptional regulator [Streptomyces libani subsp. libani]
MADSSGTAKTAESRARGIRATGRRRKGPTRRRRAVTITLCTLTSAVLLGGAGLGYVYFKLNGNLKGVDINAALGHDRPKNIDDGSMNILVMGSDSRAGKNGEYGKDEGGARSDTAMIVHVYKGHKKASVVSVPRDTMIKRPDCAKDGKDVPGAQRAMFNTAFEVGGPACAVKTVESISDVRMDHFVEVDFTGFKKLIDALGGVDITTSKAIDDDHSHLHLQPGKHTLNGEQSLGLVRTRHGVPGGDGSDLGRIQLQQAFIKALMNQVKNVGVLTNPTKLYDIADTATKAITTDTELNSVSELTGLAKSLGNIGSENIDMVTLPVTYDPANPDRVVPLTKKSDQVWDALRVDKEIPKSAIKGSAGDQGGTDKYVK